jgi:thiamine-monophosphate kinase
VQICTENIVLSGKFAHYCIMNRPSEDEMIARWFAPLAGPGGLGLRDDAALIQPPPGHEIVVTVDALIAGVHFFADDPPASIAIKALGVNLSDLAAKGAKPLGFVLTLALQTDWIPQWIQGFSSGLATVISMHNCQLLGGDTVATSGPLSLSITAFGTVPTGRMVKRFSAQPGDVLFVSGTIGDAALGLRLRLDQAAAWAQSLKPDQRAHLADRYLHPQPRTDLRSALLDHASAAMDVSDGLVGDLRKMMRSSGTGADIDLDTIPVSDATRAAIMADAALSEVAYTGGDDYEVLCAIPAAVAQSFQKAAAQAGIAVSPIGWVTGAGQPVRFLINGSAHHFKQGSYSHF